MHTLFLHTRMCGSRSCVAAIGVMRFLCGCFGGRTFLFYGGKENEKDIESYIDYNIANCFFI